ncbi:hypothetical protein [Hymenobacter coccineus]|uniref:Membrane fusion protein biotin-lipoyl like domain-containing protein n=1 Tax=Hymenobacter coccineus TaxID=1908235 RepID=A0A1G1TJ20_9BACT|nr:hypothetical protein [Hymenobacter coccineus]OGX90872.1 hypothetical protein BEN49_05985 [Hymenobacter coccineus]
MNAALTATGTVIPAREVVITSPIQGTIRRAALVVGTRVAPGQLILELAAPDQVGLTARTGHFPAQLLAVEPAGNLDPVMGEESWSCCWA